MAAQARERQAIAQYQKTLQEAFREVRQALAAQARSREIFAAEGERVGALREALRLARLRYESGLTGQLEFLDAERNLLQAEVNRIEALRANRAAVADSRARWATAGRDSSRPPTGAPTASFFSKDVLDGIYMIKSCKSCKSCSIRL